MTGKSSIVERLGTVAYRNQGRSDARPHIQVDTAICNGSCPHRCTTYVCPANCYTVDEEGLVRFQFEDCMYACDQGAVRWSFPDPESGRGVNWSLG